jgi:serine/threonine protein kinase
MIDCWREADCFEMLISENRTGGQVRDPAGFGLPAQIGGYEIVERVGVGGMAEAFRARAKGPGGFERELIIKRVLPHLEQDAEFVQGFMNEARILGMLNHPNVVDVYDFGVDEGRHYLAMEYLNGLSIGRILSHLRQRGRRMPLEVAVFVGQEVCRGLTAVHTLTDRDGRPLHVIHRDVSPSNVMTATSGAVKLLDFGVAKIGSDACHTEDGYVKGKVGYLAPEQVKGLTLDARVDLFTLGIVLHEMCCFESTTTMPPAPSTGSWRCPSHGHRYRARTFRPSWIRS